MWLQMNPTMAKLLLRICLAVVAIVAAWGWGWGYVWASAWNLDPLWNWGAISVWLMLITVFLIPKAWFAAWPTTIVMIVLGVASASYLIGALALPDREPVRPDVIDFVLVILGEVRIILAVASKTRHAMPEHKHL